MLTVNGNTKLPKVNGALVIEAERSSSKVEEEGEQRVEGEGMTISIPMSMPPAPPRSPGSSSPSGSPRSRHLRRVNTNFMGGGLARACDSDSDDDEVATMVEDDVKEVVRKGGREGGRNLCSR